MPGKVRAHRCLVERGIAFRLDIGAKLLAEFLVRDAEHSAVADTRQGQERGFDLGWIDVDAARNDHVALAVAKKEVTLPVEIPDIADRDETVALDVASLVRLAVIGEVGRALEPDIDLADPARWQFAAILVIDLDRRTAKRTADRAGLAQGLFRSVECDETGFRCAVILGDNGSPPIEHRLLDVRRARCGAVHDPHERRHVVPLAHFFRQVQQADKHCRHRMKMGDPILFNQLQQLFRVEAWLQDRERAVAHGIKTIEIGRRVIERPGNDSAHRLVGLKTEDLARGQSGELQKLRIQVEPLDALRMASRARGVDHARQAAGSRIGEWYATSEPLVPGSRARRRATLVCRDVVSRSDLQRGGYDEQCHAVGQNRLDLRQEVGVRDNDLGRGVTKHIADLRRLAVPIDRHAIGAEQLRRVARLEEREVVAQYKRDRVAGFDAERGKAAGRAEGATEQHLARDGALAANEAAASQIRHHIPPLSEGGALWPRSSYFFVNRAASYPS